MKVEVALKLFKEKQNLAMLKKEISEILNLLNNLEKSINHLTKQENEFLQKSYIEFLNLGENSLLELSLNFTKARYLFIKKFFENNISSFYKNFVFKEKIILNENKFEGFENLTPKDILKNDDLNAVSLYLFIENIAVKYEKTVNDRDLKDEFKQKLINLYDSVYRIFKALSPNLLEKYFDIVLYNHPMMLVELIKASLSSSYVENVISTFSEENKIFDRLKDDGSFKILDKESLVEFISIIYIKNLNLSSFIYNKSTISILNSTFNEKIETKQDVSSNDSTIFNINK